MLELIRMDPAGEPSSVPLTQDETPESLFAKQGWSPFEFLVRTYRNPMQPINDRISAARACLDYVHRKMPTELNLGGALGLGNLDFSRLSDADLKTLTQIVEKAQIE